MRSIIGTTFLQEGSALLPWQYELRTVLINEIETRVDTMSRRVSEWGETTAVIGATTEGIEVGHSLYDGIRTLSGKTAYPRRLIIFLY
jgi:hypothetical protein